MANFDGDITLSVDVTPGDVKTAAKDIQQELKEIFDDTKGNEVSKQFQNMQSSAARLYDTLGELVRRMENLEIGGKIGKDAKVTQEYTHLAERLNDVTNRAAITKNSLNELSMAEAANNATLPPLNSKFSALGLAFSEISSRASSAMSALSSKFGPLISYLKLVGSLAGKAGTALLKLAGSAIKSGISKLADSMKNLTKHTKSHNNALQMGFKNFIRYGLGVRSIFALVNKLRRAFMEGIENLAQYSPEFNNVISEFISSLATLKNAFAAAFAPVISVVLPILTALMNALIDAIAIVGKFFAALTGKNTFIKAKHVNIDYAKSLNKTKDSANDASKGLNGTKESAEELQKTIAGFDDVEILKGPDKDAGSGSSGSGGNGGNTGYTGPDINDMFETVGIESPISNFAKRLRDLIANQDWEGLGTFLGETINSIFKKAKELISWDNLGEKITFIVNAITTTFNSLVDAIDWELIGSTFAEGINTIIKTLDLLITGIDWALLGRSISEGWNGLFDNIDWEGAGKLIAHGVNAVFDFVYNALTTFKWESLGKHLATLLNNTFKTINWSRIGKTFASGVNALLNLLYGFITTFDWEYATKKLMEAISSFIRAVDWAKLGAVLSKLVIALLTVFKTIIAEFDWNGLGQSIVKFLSGIDWAGLISTILSTIARIGMSGLIAFFGLSSGIITTLIGLIDEGIAYLKEYFAQYGGDIIQGLLDGISAAIKGIGKWIKDNIFTPFIEGFKSAFGISSPSKVMKQQGTFIVQGLLAGITGAWNTITSFFKNAVNKVSSFFKNFNWSEAGKTVVQKIHSGISGAWNTVSTFFNNGVNTIKSKITNTNWGSSGSAIVSKLKSGVSSIWNSSLVSYITTGITNIRNKFTNTNWSSTGTSVINKLRSGMVSGWHSVSSFVVSGVANIRSAFASQSWSSIGSNICSGLANGIRAGWSWVTNAARSLAYNAYNAARKALRIHSPSHIFRDAVGKMIPAGMAEGIEDGSNLAVQAVQNLASTVANTDMPQLQIPSVALGEVVPYETTKNIDTLNETMKSLLDVLKYSQNNTLTRDELVSVLNTILPTMLQRYVSFYIGDEQIARHANAGNNLLDYRFNPVGR